MIDFDLQPDLQWLLGAELTTRSGIGYSIRQALLQFKLRLDETGARVKVATALAVGLSARFFEPTVFRVDRPFYGRWTQGGLACRWRCSSRTPDCWRKPSGTLEAL